MNHDNIVSTVVEWNHTSLKASFAWTKIYYRRLAKSWHITLVHSRLSWAKQFSSFAKPLRFIFDSLIKLKPSNTNEFPWRIFDMKDLYWEMMKTSTSAVVTHTSLEDINLIIVSDYWLNGLSLWIQMLTWYIKQISTMV